MNYRETLKERMKDVNESKMYECLVCLDVVKKPVFCKRCHKMMCADHIIRLKNRCPNCRASPLELTEDSLTTKIAEGIELKRRSLEKSELEYECLGNNCSFKGGYISMLKHRKKCHPELSIDYLLYDEKAKK